MSKIEFTRKCKELEDKGWSVDTYEPESKFAIYRKNGKSQTIGIKK